MSGAAMSHHRLIEELVYERVRLDADLMALTDLEEDLAKSFRRALAEAGGSAEELERLVDRAVERAFVRVAAELADELVGPDAEDGCPLCEAPLTCPAE